MGADGFLARRSEREHVIQRCLEYGWLGHDKQVGLFIAHMADIVGR